MAAVKKIYDDEDVILISSAGIIIRLSGSEVRECARPAKGVRLIKLGEGDRVIAVTTAKKTPAEDAAEPGSEAPDETNPETTTETAPAEAETPETDA